MTRLFDTSSKRDQSLRAVLETTDDIRRFLPTISNIEAEVRNLLSQLPQGTIFNVNLACTRLWFGGSQKLLVHIIAPPVQHIKTNFISKLQNVKIVRNCR